MPFLPCFGMRAQASASVLSSLRISICSPVLVYSSPLAYPGDICDPVLMYSDSSHTSSVKPTQDIILNFEKLRYQVDEAEDERLSKLAVAITVPAAVGAGVP